jgi:hypothetical protein
MRLLISKAPSVACQVSISLLSDITFFQQQQSQLHPHALKVSIEMESPKTAIVTGIFDKIHPFMNAD